MTDLREVQIDAHPTLDIEAWRAQIEKDLKGRSADKLVYRTGVGPEIQPLYTAAALEGCAETGAPGAAPYTRGASAAPKAWQSRVVCSHPDPAEANKLVVEAMEGGADAVELPLYNTTSAGGVQLQTLEDLDAALGDFDGFTSLTAGGAFDAAAALLIARWKARGVEAPEGAFNADPFGALAAGRPLPWSADEALKRLGELARYTRDNLPGVTAVAVDTTAYHHAGATPAQDLAYALATGLAYLRALSAAGLSVDEAAAQIVFRFSLSAEFFTEIARLRAARRLWSRVLEVAGGQAAPMQQVTRLSPRAITRRDPWVNMLRDTTAAFAGAVGGAQAIITTSFDAALGQPDELGRRVARNLPLILREEAGLHEVLDPAGGAYLMESLTEQIAAEAWAELQKIEAEGEMLAALQSGRVQQTLTTVWRARLARLAKRKDATTGVSAFASTAALLERPTVEREQPAKVGEPIDFEGFEDRVKAASEGFPVSSLITVGDLFEIPAPVPHTLAEPFERLMDAAEGHDPKILLANVGPIAHHTARATFSENFFQAGGFKVTHSAPHFEGLDVKAEVEASGAKIAVICGSDKLYAEHAATVAGALKAAGVRDVVLAGRPGDAEATLREAGVDRFIYLGCDVVATLTHLLRREGVLS